MPDPAPRFVRYQCAVPHPRREGVYLGIFAAVNGLAKAGRLSDDEEAFRRASNDWFNAHMPLPTDTMPAVYDQAANPLAVAWFKRSATTHLARVPGYLAVLEAHGVAWHAIATDDPGAILYEDAYQVIATPCPPCP